ncbi:mucin-13-like isoform X2 [Argopecten irradians]
MNPNCRIDLAAASRSELAIKTLKEALNSNVKLCYGCPENDFSGQCNTIIACYPQTVCYNETHRDKYDFTRHMFGCMWESDHVTLHGHHCSQPSHGSSSGTKICNSKLCNGNSGHVSQLHQVLNSIDTTPIPTTTTSTTTSPTTTTPTTTAPTTTTPTTTAPTTTTPTTTAPTTITTGQTTPDATTQDPTTRDATTQDATTLDASTPQPSAPDATTSGLSTMDLTTPEQPTKPTPTSTTARTTNMTQQSTSTPGATMAAVVTTTGPPPTPTPCPQGDGTLMCIDHYNPPNFECASFDQDTGICNWRDPKGHEFAVDNCPQFCNLCNESCEKQYNATLASKPVTAPASTRSCMVCGSEESGMPCTVRQTYYNSTKACPGGKDFCMTSVYVDDTGYSNVYKACVDETTCMNKWLAFSSDNDYCLYYGKVSIAGKYQCHFCCTDDSCNTDIYPSSHMYVG